VKPEGKDDLMDKFWAEIEAFVRKERGTLARQVITPATRLEDDLDVTGDDADQFMERFFDHFHVDTGDYNFNRYFLTEGSGLTLLLAIFSKKRREKLERVPLTLGMLANAARLGQWESSRLNDLSGP
jgi:hypothetical protein